MMADFSRFFKLAEYKEGIWHDYTTGKYHSKDTGVYAIRFSDDSLYIGSTKTLRKRVHQHYTGMLNGYHSLKQLSEAFNKTKSFEIFLLARCVNGTGPLEAMFISLLRPSLNKDSACSNDTSFNDYIFDFIQIRKP